MFIHAVTRALMHTMSHILQQELNCFIVKLRHQQAKSQVSSLIYVGNRCYLWGYIVKRQKYHKMLSKMLNGKNIIQRKK